MKSRSREVMMRFTLSRQTLPESGQQVHLLMQHGKHEGFLPFRMDVKDIAVLAPGDPHLRIPLRKL
jgi:hypothetical protein